MSRINLARVDLNLFVVFDAIYREGSLTRAAEKLYLSQPAVSHALARLREQFNDPLFERAGKGVIPTPLAKATIERVRAALQSLETTLTDGLVFDPANASRVFNIAMRDMLETTLLPPMMERLEQQAPSVQLRSLRVPRREVESALAAGQLDFAADILLPVSQDICHQCIATQGMMVVMQPQHPLAQADWSLSAYLSAQHVQVSGRAEGLGAEDVALAKAGHSRRIALRCQNYHAAMQVLKHTTLLLTLPESLARQLDGFVVRPLPFDLLPMELYLYWHRKAEADPAVMWLRDVLLQNKNYIME